MDPPPSRPRPRAERPSERKGLLRFSADRRTLSFIAGHGLLVAIGLGTWSRLGLAERIALVALLCVSAFLQAVIVHNVMHSPLWRKRSLNRLTQIALSLTYGFAASEYVPGHNLSHHRFTQSRRDIMRTTKVRFRWNLLNLLFFFLRVGPTVTLANAAFARTLPRRSPARQQLWLEIVVSWGAKALLWWLAGAEAIFLTLVPSLYAVWAITTVNYLQHDGCIADHPYDHSRNFVGRAFNWLTFNNGFHGIHHMQPGLHWSLLARAHEEVLAPHVDPRLDQPSLLVYLFRAFVLPGRRVRFDGTPVPLPEEEPDEPFLSLPGPGQPG